MSSKIMPLFASILILMIFCALTYAQESPNPDPGTEADSETHLDTIILTTTINYPDAMVASVISSSLGIPVLLTDRDSLPQDTLALIDKTAPSTIVLIGGNAVISEDVENQLSDYEVVRLWGVTRYGTAIEVASYFWPEGSNTVILVQDDMGKYSKSNSNLLAQAKELAKENNAPVLLTPSDEIPADVLEELDDLYAKNITLIGRSIKDEMVEELRDLGFAVNVIGGPNVMKTIRHRLLERWNKTTELLVVATPANNFSYNLMAPHLPNSKAVHISDEKEIGDLIPLITENMSVRVVGVPELAKKVSDAIKNETNASVILIPSVKKRLLRLHRELIEAKLKVFHLKRIAKNLLKQAKWRKRLAVNKSKIVLKINDTLQRAVEVLANSTNKPALKRLERAQKLYDEKKYYLAFKSAKEALSLQKLQEFKRHKWPEIREKVREEIKSFRQRATALSAKEKKLPPIQKLRLLKRRGR